VSVHPPRGGRPQLPCGVCVELVELRIKIMDVWACVPCAAELIDKHGAPCVVELIDKHGAPKTEESPPAGSI